MVSSTRLSSETLEGHGVFRKKAVFDYRAHKDTKGKAPPTSDGARFAFIEQ